MNTSRVVGSVTARLLAIASAVIFGWVFVGTEPGSLLRSGALIASGLLTVLGFVHAFTPIYRAWMRLAERLHAVMVVDIFGLCYLLAVPPFFAFVRVRNALRTRKRAARGSSWVERQGRIDPRSLERMG
jgi:hypothetical protein